MMMVNCMSVGSLLGPCKQVGRSFHSVCWSAHPSVSLTHNTFPHSQRILFIFHGCFTLIDYLERVLS